MGEPGKITASAVPMAGLAALAARTTGKVVVDETKLAGRYDFELRVIGGAVGTFLQGENWGVADRGVTIARAFR